MVFVKGQDRPLGAGRKRGTPNKDTSEVAKIVDEYEFSPIEVMIGMAAGDVVSLGYMTRDEYEREGRDNPHTGKYEKSGHELALEYIPAELRAQCAYKLAELLYPKRKALELSGEVTAKMPVVPIPGLPPVVSGNSG